MGVVTGLVGVSGKKGAGDGGSYKNIYIYLKGGLQYQPPNMCPQNKQT